MIEDVLNMVGRLFVVSNSKNVLQAGLSELLEVGLSGLVHVLQDYPNLLPNFVAVLLGQSPEYRRRLLDEAADSESLVGLSRSPGGERARRSYVQGNSTSMYEETSLPEVWPHLDIARTLAMQMEALRGSAAPGGVRSAATQLVKVDEEHLEVLSASLPFFFEDEEADEWLHVFDKVKQHLFTSLVQRPVKRVGTQTSGLEVFFHHFN
ncbi:unnamed protein product [Durusdinium trenchii]|uniref:Uncharacterized protein n=1 Tax=Durusdinium trenchii TaxID=1381693 RepID=A0ABP0R4N4_9DINO